MFSLLSKALSPEATEVASEIASEVAKVGFNPENVGDALLDSAAGMVGIFIVVGIIILSVSLLNKAGAAKKKD
jgi:hypothetical protein